MKRVVVTGAAGLIGWHARCRLYAANCAAVFNGDPKPFDIVALDHFDFDDDAVLDMALNGAGAILHFAGVNRASDREIEDANPAIARRLALACRRQDVSPHIVYSNSIHAERDTPYGRSKALAGEILAGISESYSDLILPHIFGECGRPFYNNVTATLITQILSDKTPKLNKDGRVDLLHAGAAAQAAITAFQNQIMGQIEPVPKSVAVPNLFEILDGFHKRYLENIFPDLNTSFDRDLFNTYRSASYPNHWPRLIQLHTDSRGSLFEAVKGGGGGQVFLSTTKPGVTRGNHFHLGKVERFLVVQGEAVIRIRKLFANEVWEYSVSGENPQYVDIPTMHTHSIQNIGNSDLLTLFWTDELFDPANPDTYIEDVLK